MDILGIGIPELGFILLIAIIILGPKDMQKAGKTAGTWMRKVVLSPEWREIKNASRQIKQIPTQLMREASLEEIEGYKRELDITMSEALPKKNNRTDRDSDTSYGAWSGISVPQPTEETNTIAPRVDTSARLGTRDEPAPVKPTSTSPEASTVKKYPSIEKEDV